MFPSSLASQSMLAVPSGNESANESSEASAMKQSASATSMAYQNLPRTEWISKSLGTRTYSPLSPINNFPDDPIFSSIDLDIGEAEQNPIACDLSSDLCIGLIDIDDPVSQSTRNSQLISQNHASQIQSNEEYDPFPYTSGDCLISNESFSDLDRCLKSLKKNNFHSIDDLLKGVFEFSNNHSSANLKKTKNGSMRTVIDYDPKKIGGKLWKIGEDLKISKEEFASILGISPRTLSNYRDKLYLPEKKLEAFAKKLKIPYAELVKGTEMENSAQETPEGSQDSSSNLFPTSSFEESTNSISFRKMSTSPFTNMNNSSQKIASYNLITHARTSGISEKTLKQFLFRRLEHFNKTEQRRFMRVTGLSSSCFDNYKTDEILEKIYKLLDYKSFEEFLTSLNKEPIALRSIFTPADSSDSSLSPTKKRKASPGKENFNQMLSQTNETNEQAPFRKPKTTYNREISEIARTLDLLTESSRKAAIEKFRSENRIESGELSEENILSFINSLAEKSKKHFDQELVNKMLKSTALHPDKPFDEDFIKEYQSSHTFTAPVKNESRSLIVLAETLRISRPLLGQAIVRERDKLSLNQKQFSTLIGTPDVKKIRRWENGESYPSNHFLQKIASAFGYKEDMNGRTSAANFLYAINAEQQASSSQETSIAIYAQ
ncbi:MAG: helix-turn-helix transcriptional regulator [Chlamydiota bacterium]